MAKKSSRYLFASLLLCIFCIGAVDAQTSSIYWAPWVTNTTTNSAIINWHGETKGSGSIDYAPSSYYDHHHKFEKTISTPDAATYQHVQLTGLEPNTSYTYWVKPSGKESAYGIRTFRTMPVSGPFTFVVFCDPQEGHQYLEPKRFKYVADAIANEKDVLFILIGGDFARFDDLSRWATFFQCADTMLAKFAMFPTIGNHEYHNMAVKNGMPTAAVEYHSAFDMPLYYSFDCAGIRFISLNTPDPNVSNYDDPQTSLALTQSQAPWLQSQLDNNMLGTFVIQHYPVWGLLNVSMNPNFKPWETLYHTYGISANFAGHRHHYERYNISSIPYFIIGTGGGPCEDITPNETHPAGYQYGTAKKLGYLKVAVDPANNTATAQQIFVAYVNEDDDGETPMLYNPPIIEDKITFPLKVNQSSSSLDHGLAPAN